MKINFTKIDSERSEAEGRAERGNRVGKRKNGRKKRYDDDDDDDDDHFVPHYFPCKFLENEDFLNKIGRILFYIFLLFPSIF